MLDKIAVVHVINNQRGRCYNYSRKIPLMLFIITWMLLISGFRNRVNAQAYVEPWGNIQGIRVDGQLMKFKTSLEIVGPYWSHIMQTGKERQHPDYVRKGNKQIITSKLGTIRLKEIVTNLRPGIAKLHIIFTPKVDTTITSAYFKIDLPKSDYIGGTIHFVKSSSINKHDVTMGRGWTNAKRQYVHTSLQGVRFISPNRRLTIKTDQPTEFLVKKSSDLNDPYIHAYFTVMNGDLKKGKSKEATFTLRVSGKIDRRPVTLILNSNEEGRTFDGIGGNFRLQNPKIDPEVIDYNLHHLRLTWGRVEMPWQLWQPEEHMNPLKAAEQGKLNPRVKAAMQMAQRLSRNGINIIVSDWWPPKWAVVGKPVSHPRLNGIWGNPLNPQKMKEIYRSITDYLLYLKKHYGVTVKMFSFNESDLGIYVRQTGREHDQLIKGLGAYFAAHGLKTKLLLGDTSDANAFNFIKTALNDPAAYPYIGAVDFHSWRGWSDTTLIKWADAAQKIHKPLIVGEGSIDAAAWGYPQVFLEPTYAIKEIGLYVKIMSIDQPESILQWQLTSDYSDMAGGGVYGNTEQPLHPTQRFWNLKQLSSTPEDLHYMPISSNRPDIICVALGNNTKNEYAIHLVNKGTTRRVKLKGLPKTLKRLTVYVTDQNRDMKKVEILTSKNGSVQFILDSMSYTTLMHE